ncbi:DNA-binding transcriptional repressor MarR [compost metagenome]
MASDTYLEKSYASRVVSSLVERNILEKLENPSDSRSVLLRLTDHGIKVHDEMHQAAIRLNDWLTATLTADQPQAFTATLRQLEGRLDALGQSFDTFENVEEAVKDTGGGAPESRGETVQIDRHLAESLAAVLAAQLKT